MGETENIAFLKCGKGKIIKNEELKIKKEYPLAR